MFAVIEFTIRLFCISILFGVCFGNDCSINTDVDGSSPVVVTKTGTIVGKYVKLQNRDTPVFLGIPFAKPPVNERRFKISEPIEELKGTLFAKEKSPGCMQYNTRKVGWIPPPTFKVSEDCLYLNVWLPSNCCCNRANKLPVMAFIHSGGLYSGSAMMDIYDGEVLATIGEVIVVAFNYRLNVFGFLNVDSKEAPGNMGLYDQLLALRWIQENIQYFGGDPNSVTLFGESAGSLSVSLQMISPLSRNLFHKAIMESGSAAHPIKVDNLSESLSKASNFSKVAGCSIDSSDRKSMEKDILNCLKSKTNEELAEAVNYFNSENTLYFTASYGNECKDCLKYFSGSPVKSAQSGEFAQIPTMVGVTKDEGTLFMVYTIPRIFIRDRNPRITMPVAVKLLSDFLNDIERTNISSNKVFNYYTENITGRTSTPLFTLSRIYSDYIMKCDNMYFADNVKDAYFYYYAHRSRIDTDAEWIGVPHFSEIPYVFGDPIRNYENYTVEDVNFSAYIIRKWTSFAHHGYPVTSDTEPKWPKFSAPDRKVFVLKPESKEILHYPSAKACTEFWKQYLFQ